MTKHPIYLLLIIISLCACTKQIQSPSINPQTSEAIWQKYLHNNTGTLNPFRVQMSLRFGEEGNTRRVTALLWGNDPTSIRLDVNAGIGVNIAKISEDNLSFLIFMPRESIAYQHKGTQKPLFNAGVPIPFNLQQLTQIILGDYHAVFGKKLKDDPAQNIGAYANDASFNLDNGPLGGTLVLSLESLPLFWQEANGWSLTLDYKDDKTTPYKLSMSHAKTGKKAILLIKEQEMLSTPFTTAQMQLILPSNIVVLPLEQAQALN